MSGNPGKQTDAIGRGIHEPPPGLAEAGAEAVLHWSLGVVHPRVAIASSFSKEDVALIALAARIEPGVRVFALDTGRLPEETYEVADQVSRRFGIAIEWYFPRTEAVERLEREIGPFGFRGSVEARRACCGVRKVEPLARALAGLDAWITGMRRAQSLSRGAVSVFETDARSGGILKINPLAAWSDRELDAYLEAHALPVSRLYARGYTSIGCAPCTRPTAPGEHPRAGRWWWEREDRRECGLHLGPDACAGCTRNAHPPTRTDRETTKG